MEDSIKRLEEIWTAEGKKLGLAKYLYYRQNEINPKLQLYARYLEVENFDYGDDYYVPTDFLEGRDPDSGKITLRVSFDEVMKRTWFRMPDFIARGDSRREELPPS